MLGREPTSPEKRKRGSMGGVYKVGDCSLVEVKRWGSKNGE